MVYKNKMLGFMSLNPLLILFIMTIIYLFLFAYFTDITLCDDQTLSELHANLSSDIINYNKANSEYQQALGLFNESLWRPEKNRDIIQYLGFQMGTKLQVVKNFLNRVRMTEANISKIDVNFVSGIKKQLFE
jgi:hypothetical protein